MSESGAKREELLQIIEEQRLEIEWLKLKIAQLEKNSSNSSKPPSSDIVKPPGPGNKKKGKRKIGGQKGHERHVSPLRPEDADEKVDCESSCCPDCGSSAVEERAGIDKHFLQYELVSHPVILTDYVQKGYLCRDCGRNHNAAVPDGLERCGITGPRLSALIGFLKGGCHASYSVTGEFLNDVLDVKLASGTLPKIIGRVSSSLSSCYRELQETTRAQPYLNIDESGFKENGGKLWIWVFKASGMTLFKVADSRSSDVLLETLSADYTGIIGSDFYGAYRKFLRKAQGLDIQFCLAHLIRELRFFKEKGERGAVGYANRLLKILKQMFELYHQRDGTEEYTSGMKELQSDFLRVGCSSNAKGIGKLVKRFSEYGENYFRFVDNPGIEPTNNQAERSIRHVVIDRKVTQGVRGAVGRRWCERIWSVRASCLQQNRSCFNFLYESIRAHVTGARYPSLVTC